MIQVQASDGVATVALDRPERRNSMDAALVAALAERLRALDRDPHVRAIVLTGAPPGFCAGSDLKYIGRLPRADMCAFEADTGNTARLIGSLDKPVIAAVEGFAIGGGFILAASCDLIVTAADARWHLPEVPIGWLTPWGLQALIARVGPVAARTLCFGAQPLDGVAVHELGVADELAPSGGAVERATAVAARLASLPQSAVRATKRFFASRILGNAEALDVLANRYFAENCSHPAAVATLTRFGTA